MQNRDPNNPTAFTQPPQQVRGALQPNQAAQEQPLIHPAVAASPEALAYQLGASQRLAQRAAGLPKYVEPTPGIGPSMPPLDAPHRAGMTIAAQAGMHGPTHGQMAATAASAHSIVEGPRPAVGSLHPGAPAPKRTPAQMGLLNADMLPQEATRDPAYIQGQGAQYAVNQPELALKYGVLRNGQHIPPQAIQANIGGAGKDGRIGNRSIENTIHDLQQLAGAQPPKGVAYSEEEAEAQAQDSASSASSSAGTPVRETAMREALKRMDDFDFEAFRKQMHTDVLNNPEQRGIIEERLSPLSIDDLIMHDRVSQMIPVVPDRFWFVLQSATAEDDLALKRLLMLESGKTEVTSQHLLDKFSIMAVAAGVESIRNNAVPTHLDNKGLFNEELFWKKFNYMLRRPVHMLASLGVNHTWFEMRVRKLFVAEKIKNG